VLAATDPNALARAYDQLTRDPAHHSDRQHRMKGNLAAGKYQGKTFDRWQYGVTSAGRIWYFIEDPTGRSATPRSRPRRRVLVEMVSAGHPKATEP
jgi:hypothetical protein